MDANATALLHNKKVLTTDESSKYIWNQVCVLVFI